MVANEYAQQNWRRTSMIMLRKILIAVLALLVFSIVPTACVNNAQLKKPPMNSELEPRVLSRWNTLMDGEFEQAYEFFSPSHRKLFPLEHYLSNTGSTVQWLSVEVESIKFDGNRASVLVALEHRLILPMGVGDDFGKIGKDIVETWLWVNGQWWYTDDGAGSLFK